MDLVCCVCEKEIIDGVTGFMICVSCRNYVCNACLKEHDEEGCIMTAPHCWKCCEDAVREIG